MKKLTLFVAFALTTGFAMSQNNTSIIDQDGGNQKATVTQTGSVNVTSVKQFTDNTGPQISEVIQNGIGNAATVTQNQTGGGGHSVPNKAYIEQIGTSNMAIQSENAPGYNSGQHVWGKQIGTSNVLFQEVTSGHTISLKAIQDGTGNIAAQTANGAHNTGEVYQEGDRNYANQTMGGSNNGYGSAVVLIDQLGNDNTALQMFNGIGSSHKNNGEIYQIGEFNESNQIIVGRDNDITAFINGSDNTTNQVQNGDGNKSTVKIGFQNTPTYASDFNQVSTVQQGNSNSATFGLTKGNSNDVTIFQAGNSNFTEMSVKYGDNNTLNETAFGNENRTRLNINAAWGQNSSGNEVNISKNGNGNYVAGVINGDNNDVDIVQFGNNNRIGTSWHTADGVNIMGNGNTVGVQQYSDGNMSLNSVVGNGNFISVTQN